MSLESTTREQLASGKLSRPPDRLQGVTKQRIEVVLASLARGTRDQVDAVFALIDDQTPNFFAAAKKVGMKFCEGATTAHIGCHIGVLQRGAGKLDREGRDYWLKPLWEIGALERVYFDPNSVRFLPGHPVAKSPNSAYRVARSFVEILVAGPAEWKRLLDAWGNESAIRIRLTAQAELGEATRGIVGSPHEALVTAACKYYVQRFLAGFEPVYIDVTDGDRVTEEDRVRLAEAGLRIDLADAMPDVLLWNRQTDWLWVIEAVTSDGEVDVHKVDRMRQLASRHGKAGVGFTTAYADWKCAAARQGRHKNLPPGTFLWIQEDGSKQFRVEG